MSRIYDISVPIRSGGLVYPGNPEIDITLQQAVAKGASANVSTIRFGSHTGTHADAARHFFDDGQPVDKIPLERLIGPARLVSFSDGFGPQTPGEDVSAQCLVRHRAARHSVRACSCGRFSRAYHSA